MLHPNLQSPSIHSLCFCFHISQLDSPLQFVPLSHFPLHNHKHAILPFIRHFCIFACAHLLSIAEGARLLGVADRVGALAGNAEPGHVRVVAGKPFQLGPVQSTSSTCFSLPSLTVRSANLAFHCQNERETLRA